MRRPNLQGDSLEMEKHLFPVSSAGFHAQIGILALQSERRSRPLVDLCTEVLADSPILGCHRHDEEEAHASGQNHSVRVGLGATGREHHRYLAVSRRMTIYGGAASLITWL